MLASGALKLAQLLLKLLVFSFGAATWIVQQSIPLVPNVSYDAFSWSIYVASHFPIVYFVLFCAFMPDEVKEALVNNVQEWWRERRHQTAVRRMTARNRIRQRQRRIVRGVVLYQALWRDHHARFINAVQGLTAHGSPRLFVDESAQDTLQPLAKWQPDILQWWVFQQRIYWLLHSFLSSQPIGVHTTTLWTITVPLRNMAHLHV
jgi:hypothetical protein